MDSLHPQDEKYLAAQSIARTYLSIGYQAIGVSSKDLILGDSFFYNSPLTELPLLSVNVTKEDGSLAFSSEKLILANSLRIGVTAVTDKNHRSETFDVIDYISPLEQVLQKLSAQADLIILLSSLSAQENRSIAKQFPTISIIISSGPPQQNRQPELIGTTLLTTIKARGKYLGQLLLRYNGNKGWSPYSSPYPEELKEHVEAISKRIVSLENTYTKDRSERIIKKITWLKTEREKLQAEFQHQLNRDTLRTTNSFQSNYQPIVPQRPTSR